MAAKRKRIMRKMNYVLLIAFAGLFVSCINNQNPHSAKEEKTKNAEKTLPAGWSSGDISPYIVVP